MKESIVINKSFCFAIRIVNFYKLLKERKEYILCKQILRSGTSIGANVRESHNSESKSDFIHKLAIAQKEADETRYWLELLYETNYIDKIEFDSLHSDATELLKIIKSIIKTTKINLSKEKSKL